MLNSIAESQLRKLEKEKRKKEKDLKKQQKLAKQNLRVSMAIRSAFSLAIKIFHCLGAELSEHS